MIDVFFKVLAQEQYIVTTPKPRFVALFKVLCNELLTKFVAKEFCRNFPQIWQDSV